MTTIMAHRLHIVNKFVTLFIWPLQVQRAFPPYSVHTEGLLETATRNLRNNLFSTIQASWCCWPVINFLNFKFVPAPYR